MRLVLKAGKQREIIKEEKTKLNLTWPQLAKELDIKFGRLMAYYYEGSLIPEEVFNKLTLKEEFERWIIERKSENWGKSKGGKNSSGSTKKIKFPKESEKLAEFYGIMLGDGNLNVKRAYKIGTYQIRVVGDSRYDCEYLTKYVSPLIEQLFQIKVNITKSKNSNALNLISTGRKLAEFLESKGFKPGDKIKNQLEIPSWIKNKPQFLRACIRGLYDTDGTIYKLTNQNSYQIGFTNYNSKLLNEVRQSLVLFGISPSKIMRNRDIVITKKSELRKFLNEVGFHNFKHLNKAKMWNLAS